MTADDVVEIRSPLGAGVAHLAVQVGDVVESGAALLYLEVMKMEQPVPAPRDGRVTELLVAAGDQVRPDQLLARLGPGDRTADRAEATGHDTHGRVRDDLRQVRERHAKLHDEARPEAARSRHQRGHRTVRENLADLLDDGSFTEYGGLAIAAQRRRRSEQELIDRTPGDGMVTGLGTVNAALVGTDRARVAVAAYDYTVLAGTQGQVNHRKKDRLFDLAARSRLPVVIFAEGGGGRPGDTDAAGASWLDAQAFRLFAGLSGDVPLVAIVNGRCFAGNAALAGCADVIIATESTNLGMAGPAMIEGGGLGAVSPDDVGPVDVQRANGVIDVVVADEAEAVAVAKRYLSYTQGTLHRLVVRGPGGAAGRGPREPQTRLRHAGAPRPARGHRQRAGAAPRLCRRHGQRLRTAGGPPHRGARQHPDAPRGRDRRGRGRRRRPPPAAV